MPRAADCSFGTPLPASIRKPAGTRRVRPQPRRPPRSAAWQMVARHGEEPPCPAPHHPSPTSHAPAAPPAVPAHRPVPFGHPRRAGRRTDGPLEQQHPAVDGASRGRYTYAAHKGDYGNVLAAINFLNWLDTQRLSLPQLQQRHLDTWAIGQPCAPVPSPSSAGALHDASARPIWPSSTQPPNSQATSWPRTSTEESCCAASTTPRCPWSPRFGCSRPPLRPPLTRIVELTDDHIRHDQGHTYLTANRHPSCSRQSSPASSTISYSTAPGTATRPGADTSCPATALDARAIPSVSPTP